MANELFECVFSYVISVFLICVFSDKCVLSFYACSVSSS